VFTPESSVLSAWYSGRPEVRRLLAIRDAQGLRVLVELEPAGDSDEIHPAWIANHQAWTDELQCHTGTLVRLEHLGDGDEVETDGREVIVAALSWRAPASSFALRPL
jgi:hypothetical protein